MSVYQIYDATLALASFLEFDNNLRSEPARNFERCLSASDRRQFLEIIRTAAPWVRSFPSARAKDEETGNFLKDVAVRESQIQIVERAALGNLISQQDRELMLSLLEAMARAGLPAKKAGIRGVFSVKNLVYAIALGATTLIGDAAMDTKLYTASKTFLTENMDQVIDAISDAPDDIKLIVEDIIHEIEKDGLPNLPNNDPVISSNLPSSRRRKSP